MTGADFKALRTPVIVLGVIAACVAGAVYFTNGLAAAARADLVRQQGLLRDARTRLQRSGEEKEIIVRYLGAYRQLESRGFVGGEKRINWLDALRQANQQADLFGVDYRIGTQKPYSYLAEFDPAPIQLRESVMQLRFRLLHEDDLIRFLALLRQQNAGFYTVEQCSLRPLDNRGIIRYQPNLSVECELSWITARVESPGEKKP